MSDKRLIEKNIKKIIKVTKDEMSQNRYMKNIIKDKKTKRYNR